MSSEVKSRKRPARRLLIPMAVVAWVMVIIILGLPRLREIKERGNQIADISSRLDQLGNWRDASPQGLYTSSDWDSIMNLNYPRYFPREQSVEEYFYQLASTASVSGVDPIIVQNLDKNRGRGDLNTTITCEYADDDVAGLREQMAAADLPEPISGLTPHHVNLQFESTYSNLVQFLNKLTEVKRAMSINKVDLKQSGERVGVTMELEYYVQAEN